MTAPTLEALAAEWEQGAADREQRARQKEQDPEDGAMYVAYGLRTSANARHDCAKQLRAYLAARPASCEIRLTRGLVAIVDEADYESLSQHKWYAKIERTCCYAAREADGVTIRMHRALMPDAECVDHINGNGLDNRRSNLRAATNAQNQHNQRHNRSGKTSKYKGVSWHSRHGKWTAQIQFDGEQKHLGMFSEEDAAALAYNAAASKLFGEFAALNEVANG